MSNSGIPEPKLPAESATEPAESFGDLLSQYEKSHSRKNEDGGKQLVGTVIVVSGDSVFLDIGFKSEGILPLAALQGAGETVKPGDKLPVSVKGRDPEGYYQLTRAKVERPKDWSALEKAFADKATIVGTVTGVIKGGLSVDVGVRAFMPASRSGARDAVEMEKMVEQEILCRIIKLDVTDEDVVVDRRVVAEEEERSVQDRRSSAMKEGDSVSGTVRSLTDYGAFVDLGGVDALLHVSDIAWSRIEKAADVLSVGQQIEVRVLKIANDSGKRRISVGMKQLQAHPWDAVAGKYTVGERVRGTVTRVAEFGAFVELEPGIEGLIHVSEMSWGKKMRSASTLVKPGEIVDAVILGVNTVERRMSLGLKQTLGDPWAEVAQKFAVGSAIEGPVVSITKFGAFVQLSEGVEGMIHISEMSAEKRINHPQEVLRMGQVVRAQVLAVDSEKRQLRLSMKQLVPSGLDEYIAEHKEGDLVTGRMLEITDGRARVELGEGVLGTCRMDAPSATEKTAPARPASSAKPDLSSLGSMLQARWKGGAPAEGAKPEPVRSGQIRKFRIVKLDPAAKKIELDLA
ncbi:MAG TPA: S1 RNA-binding domain-containing protein [Candidatus Dormibacteraeota bacterium]|jgi:small subunit ribosomal protein S1|nr:S1 RNA-binding domain-containing protein [Candidatus Dormibacteraeota bacterium]